MASDEFEPEPRNVIEFRTWFSEHGGYIYPSVQFKPVAFGLSVHARDTTPANAHIVSCPFSVIITPESSKSALSTLLKCSPALDKWTERQLICTYLCFHWVLGDSKPSTLPSVLAHLAYLQTLPSPANLRTPLQFTSRELDAFKGSNLYGATLDRKRDWEVEWEECRSVVASVDESWGTGFTWDRYLTASTYLSSRAFPSTVLSLNPSTPPTISTHPVLLPGVDALNHSRAAPVSWITTHRQVPDQNSTVAIVLHKSTPAGEELFNNYGPKPNSELILGYGFALPSNPYDTIVLQIGVGGNSSNSSQGERKKFEIGRAATGADALWEEVLTLVARSSDSTERTYEDHLEGAGMLGEMLLASVDRLPEVDASDELRPEVKEMLSYYLEGQRDILQSLLEFARDKEQAAIESASAQGIEVVFEDMLEGDYDDESPFDDADGS